MKKKLYAVVDIETTGGLFKRDRITEIGIVLHDGDNIVDEWGSLINPGRSIPPHITRITGITNKMVEDAPFFYEVAKEVVEKTENAIFVAHNVRFDYSFIKQAFEELGYTFTKKQLCTVRLSRKAFPGLRSYSLGNLIKHFGISVENRHRALDDARATAILLGSILQQNDSKERIHRMVNQGVKESRLPQNISLEFLHSLPEKTGVYYFYNSYGTPVYIGKSINIKKRVMQHFTKTTKKAENLQKYVNSISFELTGSELASKVLESEEIKHYLPEINKAQRTREYPYFIYYDYDDKGYLCFHIMKSNIKNRRDKQILGHFSSKRSAKNRIKQLQSALELCGKKCGLDTNDGPCVNYQVQNCFGACVGEESALDYNDRAWEALPFLMQQFEKDFILTDIGRNADEISVFLVQDGHYRGFGYISKEFADMGLEELMESVRRIHPNPELNGIVRNHMMEHSLTFVEI